MLLKCPKHRDYKALRPPTAKCSICKEIWRSEKREKARLERISNEMIAENERLAQ